MVVGERSADLNNIMDGIVITGGLKQHNPKKKLKQRFDIIKKLGQGTFGKVQLGINKETGQEVAIKVIKKSKIESEADLVRIRREIQIMSSVRHPNIIHIYEVFENKEKMVLVMEYAAGGELYDYLSERKVLSEEEARRIFRQIATACYYCHKHKICHRDLKLENILLDENNNAKIADFGLSNVFDDQRMLSTFCGSPLYASPEIVKGTPYNGPEVDCWSLGVLLYTLVYGAMPFDGSNFKRLVKQISQGDYFEPTKPSPASPLIREMLTVNPKNRANIEKICTHWWVNENFDDENCLEVSEELANQTPVRLDLLLSLAPPPPQLVSDKLVVTEDVAEDNKTDSTVPTRSQSAGSLMDFSHPAEKRIKELLNEEKASAKRKLETALSTDSANLDRDVRKKDKIIKENTVADISIHGTIQENVALEDESMSEAVPLDKSLTQTISRDMDVEPTLDITDPSLQGAACVELLADAAAKAEAKKPNKIKKTLPTSISSKKLEGINEAPSQENVVSNVVNKENAKETAKELTVDEKPEMKSEPKGADKKKVVKKKVLADKDENVKSSPSTSEDAKINKQSVKAEDGKSKKEKSESKSEESPPKTVERRRSRIFEAAEKFQNMMVPAETKPTQIEKPKKIVIPGVSVDGFKKEFERKASLTSTSPPKVKGTASKKTLIDKQQSTDQDEEESEAPAIVEQHTKKDDEEAIKEGIEDSSELPANDDRDERVRNAVSIISSALDKEGTRKSKSRPCCIRKPPVPFGVSGRSASGNIGLIGSPLSPPPGPKPFIRPHFDTKPSEVKQVEEDPTPAEENQTSSAEITFKSATLPRRKTTKAEIKLNYPVPKPATMEFKTEMAHPVEAQRSEVIVPVGGPAAVNFRSTSLEPEQSKMTRKERIIPISFEKPDANRESVKSPTVKPPMPKVSQKPSQPERSGSLSRQSTQESDSETTSGEPIRKSNREYIIPIAIEGGGYITPRSGSLEPSETSSSTSTMTNKSRSKFSRPKRTSDRDSEDESPYSPLYRHSSFGKENGGDDSQRDAFHFHRLRSTRPKRTVLEHNDSLSSGDEDDDDGFEILTAEHLFSNLLSRVRDLTQKLNVEDGGRPGFPGSRLLSQFDHGTNFWNFHNRLDPLSRHSTLSRSLNRGPATPWRRSVSRDLASDIESVYKEASPTASRPTGDKKSKNENLNLSDIDLKKVKLSEEDALALSYLTPGLSRRIQKQLLSQLAPSEIKKLQRTLSSCDNNTYQSSKKCPRRSVDRNVSFVENCAEEKKYPTYDNKDFEVVGSKFYHQGQPDSKTKANPSFTYERPRTSRSTSLPGPKINASLLDKNSDSSHSDSLSLKKADLNNGYSFASRRDSSSKYPESSILNKYSSPAVKYVDSDSSELKRPASSPRRVSRFLRPDFFDPHKCENIVVKEKKEREMETQKVLKEIRDKRKCRLSARRERSVSREKSTESGEKSYLEKSDVSAKYSDVKDDALKDTNYLLNSVTNDINNLVSNANSIHDYVNVPAQDQNNIIPECSDNMAKTLHDYVNVKSQPNTSVPVVKKSKVSKLIRPKSYPTERLAEKQSFMPVSPEKEQSVSQIKKESDGSAGKTNAVTKDVAGEEKATKNRLLQTLERKLEKFRSASSAKHSDEVKAAKDKKSGVENTIKLLREQSLPRNLEHCTESGLIKRAVSVEDFASLEPNSKPLQASRKSVTKILGLFKRYEEQDGKASDKAKKKKNKEVDDSSSEVQLQNEIDESSDRGCFSPQLVTCGEHIGSSKNESKPERPRSLLFDRLKNYQNGATSDTAVNDKGSKQKSSKLPVNSFRRSLNLDSATADSIKSPHGNSKGNDNDRFDRKHLKLDLTKIPGCQPKIQIEPTPSTSGTYHDAAHLNRNYLTPSDSSAFLSPDDNASCDSWSVYSDYHAPELSSPVSPNGHICSGDEGESVIDRIRRKSFYTRFNENKRPRKPSLARNYKDLDLYKDLASNKSFCDYGSLDRRSCDYRLPVARTHSTYNSSANEPAKRNKAYTRSSSLMSDYVNMPNRYHTFSSKLARPTSLVYSDAEDAALDDYISTAKSRKYSSPFQPSRLNRTSVSPTSDQYYVGTSTSPSVSNVPSPSEPVKN